MEDGMKLPLLRWTGMLLLGVLALAPAVQAGSRYQGYRQPAGGTMDYGQGSGGYVGAPYRIYPDENRWGRSYYYEDPYCGIRDSHLSRLTAHYDECGHPPVVTAPRRLDDQHHARTRPVCKIRSGLVSSGASGCGPEPRPRQVAPSIRRLSFRQRSAMVDPAADAPGLREFCGRRRILLQHPSTSRPAAGKLERDAARIGSRVQVARDHPVKVLPPNTGGRGELYATAERIDPRERRRTAERLRAACTTAS
jgi:hypothetical protein